MIVGRGFGHKSLKKLEQMEKKAALTNHENIEKMIDALQTGNSDILEIYDF